MISRSEILRRLVDRLKSDPTLSAMTSGRIYNSAPQDEPLPMIRIRTDTGTEWDTKTSDGWQMSVVVDIWTDHRGDLQSLELSDRVEFLLHGKELELSVGQSLLLRHTAFDSFTEPDGITHHTVMRYTHIATT